MDVEDEEFWNFGPSKQQKGFLKSKKHSYKLLDQCINKDYSEDDAETNSPYFL